MLYLVLSLLLVLAGCASQHPVTPVQPPVREAPVEPVKPSIATGPERLSDTRIPTPPPQPVIEAELRTPTPRHLVIPSIGVDAVHTAVYCDRGFWPILPAGLLQLVCDHDTGIQSTYLAAHNWSVLQSLQHAYRNGRLPIGTEARYTDEHGITRTLVLTEAVDHDRWWVNSEAGVPFRLSLFAPCDGCLILQTCWDGSATVPSTRYIFTRWEER